MREIMIPSDRVIKSLLPSVEPEEPLIIDSSLDAKAHDSCQVQYSTMPCSIFPTRSSCHVLRGSFELRLLQDLAMKRCPIIESPFAHIDPLPSKWSKQMMSTGE